MTDPTPEPVRCPCGASHSYPECPNCGRDRSEGEPVKRPKRRNRYTCDTCRGYIITEDRHDGVTPMFLACRATDGCQGTMGSSMYPNDSALYVGVDPDYEWFRPTAEELEAYLEDVDPQAHQATRQHVEDGGLLIREATP